MLNERDRRALSEIERHLAAEDRLLRSIAHRAHRSDRWSSRGLTAAMVLAGLSTVICIALASAATLGAGLVSALLFAVLAVVHIRGIRGHQA
jgi:Protein of unknown function (DUF3040)